MAQEEPHFILKGRKVGLFNAVVFSSFFLGSVSPSSLSVLKLSGAERWVGNRGRRETHPRVTYEENGRQEEPSSADMMYAYLREKKGSVLMSMGTARKGDGGKE